MDPVTFQVDAPASFIPDNTPASFVPDASEIQKMNPTETLRPTTMWENIRNSPMMVGLLGQQGFGRNPVTDQPIGALPTFLAPSQQNPLVTRYAHPQGVGQGLFNVGADLVNGIGTPGGILLTGFGGALPSVAQTSLRVGFAGLGAKGVHDILQQPRPTTTGGQVERAGDLLLNAMMMTPALSMLNVKEPLPVNVDTIRNVTPPTFPLPDNFILKSQPRPVEVPTDTTMIGGPRGVVPQGAERFDIAMPNTQTPQLNPARALLNAPARFVDTVDTSVESPEATAARAVAAWLDRQNPQQPPPEQSPSTTTGPTMPTVPDPNWQVTVQAPQKLSDTESMPGYVQIDDVSNGQNNWSMSPQTLAQKGVAVSDFSQLPQGKYTYQQAEQLLKGGQNAVQELRPDQLSQAQPPGDLQTVGKEIRQGTTAEGLARQEGQKQVEPLYTPGTLFTHQAIKVLGDRFPKPDTKIEVQQMVNTIRNKLGENSSEWKMWKDLGIDKAPVQTPKELAKWMEENGPKVEVRKFGEKANTPNLDQANQLSHELETLGYRILPGRMLRRTVDSREYDLNAPQLSQEARDRAIKFFELEPKAEQEKLTRNKDVAYWQSIAPKSKQNMPGYVEIAVVRGPHKEKYGPGTDEQGNVIEGKGTYEDVKFPSSHNFPPNTLGFVRGYMENIGDKKVFHVIEVQSDWAQRVRDEQSTAEGYSQSGKKQSSDPLLPHYERLALKAAIEHAREQGATYIAVQDAESAMMMEGHDRVAKVKTVKDGFKNRDDALDWIDKQPVNKQDNYSVESARQVDNGYYVVVDNTIKVPTQEKGMRLHYDQTLQRIASELTGAKGEKVSLGEHKMAMTTSLNNGPEFIRQGGQPHTPRKDLIFRNPDNTPKTDVSTLMYPIDKLTTRRASSEPFSTMGKTYGGIPVFDPDLWKGMAHTYQDLKKTISANLHNKGNSERTVQLLDAADNQAKINGRQAGNRVRVTLPDSIDRQALTFITEAKDATDLQTFKKMVAGKDSKAEQALNRAISQYTRLKPHADALASQLERQRKGEEGAGIDTEYLTNYMKHAFDGPDVGVMDIGPGGTGVSTSFLKARTYPDYATAIAEGAVPKSLDAANLLESRVAAGQKLMNRLQWSNELKQLKTANGEPFATDMVKRGKSWSAPDGYVPIETTPGVRVAINKEYADIMHALLGDSFVRKSSLGRGALQVEAALKHGLLLFDSYHAFRMMRKELFLSHQISYNKGRSLLEYDEPTIQRLVKNGEIDTKTAEWVKRNRPTAELLVRNGLNVGRIAEALYSKVISRELKIAGFDVNIPGRFNKWVFEKLSRGAMMESALVEFERAKKSHPEWSEQQVALHTAKQINVFFGNLQRQGIFKSQSARDLLQIAFLAPQWVESMAQTEARAAKQLLEVPVDVVTKRRIQIGTSAKGVATGIVAWIVANQLINMFTRGQPTWKNKEEGHKLDAWLPDITGKSSGFWMSPLADTAEITHDFIRYGRTGKGVVGSTAQILQNKLSPLGRSEEVLRTGRDYSGTKLDESERIKVAAKSLMPTPLPLAGFQSDVPGQGQKQLYSSVGVKLESVGQHEALDADVKKMSLRDRIAAERKFQENKTPTDPASKAKAAEIAIGNIVKRGSDIQSELDSKNRTWLESRQLRLSGFDNKLDVGGVALYLTEKETQQLKELVVKNYLSAIEDLKNSKDFQDASTHRRQDILDLKLTAARTRARAELKKKLDSNNESN